MRSFKKMLAALSAVTIAFGAMALSASAVSYNGNGSVSVEDLGTLAEGGVYRISFTTTDASTTKIAIGFSKDEANGYEWIGTLDTTDVQSDGEGGYYVDFAYDTVANNYTIADIAFVSAQNWSWGEGELTFTDISYIAPQSETPVSFPATELEDMIAPEGEDYDGWYARTFTFSYESDTSVKYAVTVDGEEVAKSGLMSGPVTCGIIAGSQNKEKLAAMATPLITVE